MKTKAAVLYKTGEPLVVEDGIDVPDLLTGQVLVRIAFSGVCRSQLMEVRGKRGPDPYLPHLLGHEGTGVVLGIGKGVAKVHAGDKVVLTWIKGKGSDVAGTKYTKGDIKINAGGVTTFGEIVIVSENRCVPLPAGVPLDVGSLLGCAVPTGVGLVMNTMQPKPEDSIAIFGVGGVGMCAVMGAKACGCATIIAADIDNTKLDAASQLGATHVVDASACDPVAAIREIARGGVDFSTDTAGRTSTIEQAFESVRPNGGLCIFASHPPAGEKIRLDPFHLISGRRISGSWGGDTDPDRDVPRYARMYNAGQLPLDDLVTHRFPLAQVNGALDLLETGNAGRILLEIDSTLG